MMMQESIAKIKMK